MPTYTIQSLTAGDAAWVAQFVKVQWRAETVVAHGIVYHPYQLPGLVAMNAGEKVGLLTYHIEGDSCEIVTINSLQSSLGVGTALIEAVKNVALQAGCKRLWLITTNDNLNGLRFYQKRGFVLVAIHKNAMEQARKLKPEIPFIGNDGIPLRDEIELEMLLVSANA